MKKIAAAVILTVGALNLIGCSGASCHKTADTQPMMEMDNGMDKMQEHYGSKGMDKMQEHYGSKGMDKMQEHHGSK